MTRWIEENAFFVLDLPVDCSAMDVERQGQKLLGMLELNLQSARRYETPNGEQSRSSEQVRHAMAELREPRRRLVHELWAGPSVVPAVASHDGDSVWAKAFIASGWLKS